MESGIYSYLAASQACIAPAIAAELALLLDNPVAGDDKGDGVGAHHEADGSGGHL